ncbi:MerR family transcriptional regulator [Clostridium kluyveri]|uniref:MerR family transcriptional regulator n=1 Tax=Clostridium kluyveri TaxID=1534 RepID=A0A1L5F9T6_CLOKL|nr:MerR family transcriptional regulator [Clostridium kluyveri]APM39775.1 MerR family transcriptional regulator [Clostridium kluyveri]UZQ50066.1 MerR family transcriptional regulator [Clostridium kluyveri]
MYTITEAAKRCGLTAHTLRFYDKEGLLPFVDRTPSGIRTFKESDFEWLNTISCLKDTGMPIKRIREFIDLCMHGNTTLEQRLKFLRNHKLVVEKQMNELKMHMKTINHKIQYYETVVEAGIKEIHNK